MTLAGSATVCVLLTFSVMASLAHAPSAQVFLSCIFCLWFVVCGVSSIDLFKVDLFKDDVGN